MPIKLRFKKQIPAMITSAISLTLLLSQSSVIAESKPVLLEPQTCLFESTLKSKSSVISTNVLFINKKRFRVKVYWIDFAGKRQHYFDLEPNQVRWQQTFLSHPWVITDAGANQPCLDIFLPPLLTDGVAIID